MEYQQVIYYLVHEVAVVRYHDEASFKSGKVFFQDVQCDDVQVVCRLIQYQEVGVGDEYGAEVESSSLTAAKLVDVAMLFFRRKEKMLQELRGGEFATIPQVDYFCDVLYHINHFHLFIEQQSLLAIITEVHCFADFKAATVGYFFTEQHLYEG